MGRVVLGLPPDGPARVRAVLAVLCDDDGGASREPVHASALGAAGAAAVAAAAAASGSSASTSIAATITPKQRAGADGNRGRGAASAAQASKFKKAFNPTTWLACRTRFLASAALATPPLGSPLAPIGRQGIP